MLINQWVEGCGWIDAYDGIIYVKLRRKERESDEEYNVRGLTIQRENQQPKENAIWAIVELSGVRYIWQNGQDVRGHIGLGVDAD